jgi:hypothetical protein
MTPCRWFSGISKDVVPSSSRDSGSPKERLLTFKDEGTTVLLTVGTHSHQQPGFTSLKTWAPQKCSYEKLRSREFTLIYFTLHYITLLCLWTSLYSRHPAESRQLSLSSESWAGRPNRLTLRSAGHDLHLYSVPCSYLGQDNGCPDIFVVSVSSNTQKPGGNTIRDFKLPLSNSFQFNRIHIRALVVKIQEYINKCTTLQYEHFKIRTLGLRYVSTLFCGSSSGIFV